MTQIDENALEGALFAFLKERSAQMGEPLYREWFDEYKQSNAEVFDEELVQMRCGISAYLSALPPVIPSDAVEVAGRVEVLADRVKSLEVENARLRISLTELKVLLPSAPPESILRMHIDQALNPNSKE